MMNKKPHIESPTLPEKPENGGDGEDFLLANIEPAVAEQIRETWQVTGSPAKGKGGKGSFFFFCVVWVDCLESVSFWLVCLIFTIHSLCALVFANQKCFALLGQKLLFFFGGPWSFPKPTSPPGVTAAALPAAPGFPAEVLGPGVCRRGDSGWHLRGEWEAAGKLLGSCWEAAMGLFVFLFWMVWGGCGGRFGS